LDTFGEITPPPLVADQKPPYALVVVADKATVPFAQELPPLVNETTGVLLTVMVMVSWFEQPLAPVPVTT